MADNEPTPKGWQLSDHRWGIVDSEAMPTHLPPSSQLLREQIQAAMRRLLEQREQEALRQRLEAESIFDSPGSLGYAYDAVQTSARRPENIPTREEDDWIGDAVNEFTRTYRHEDGYGSYRRILPPIPPSPVVPSPYEAMTRDYLTSPTQINQVWPPALLSPVIHCPCCAALVVGISTILKRAPVASYFAMPCGCGAHPSWVEIVFVEMTNRERAHSHGLQRTDVNATWAVVVGSYVDSTTAAVRRLLARRYAAKLADVDVQIRDGIDLLLCVRTTELGLLGPAGRFKAPVHGVEINEGVVSTASQYGIALPNGMLISRRPATFDTLFATNLVIDCMKRSPDFAEYAPAGLMAATKRLMSELKTFANTGQAVSPAAAQVLVELLPAGYGVGVRDLPTTPADDKPRRRVFRRKVDPGMK